MTTGDDRQPVNFFAAVGFDRAAQRRTDADWVADRLGHPQTRVLPVWRSHSLVLDGSGLGSLTVDDLSGLGIDEDPVFLGIAETTAFFAADISHVEDPHALDVIAAQGRFEDLRSIGAMVERQAGALMAYARGMAIWHSRHRFCGVCGAATVVEAAGHHRRCSNPACGATHFPRTDPAVIVLVHDGDDIVLGRSPNFIPGMYSVLAGFVEPGEQLEDTVRREVFEEVGVEVGEVTYHSSQPWPFPSSLMIGFRAKALTRTINVDGDELDDAGWYSRADLRASPEDESFKLPRRQSIARRLVDEWLAEG